MHRDEKFRRDEIAPDNPHDWLDISLSELDLSVRTVNCLEEYHIMTVRELLGRTREQLLEIPNFGEKTLAEVFTALAKIGFYEEGKERRLLDEAEKQRQQRKRVLQAYGVDV